MGVIEYFIECALLTLSIEAGEIQTPVSIIWSEVIKLAKREPSNVWAPYCR